MNEQGNMTTNAADLPKTVFDSMDKEAVVSTLTGIKQEANAVVSSGDHATSANALKLGTIAHVLLGVIEALFPASRPYIEGGEVIAEDLGLEPKPAATTEQVKPFGFLGL